MTQTVATVKDIAYYDKAETSKKKNNKKKDKENYYNEEGNAPGYFYGKGASSLGLTGEAQEGALKSLVEGRNPKSGEHLFKFKKAKYHATDCCFSAPKDFTIVAEFDTAHRKEFQKIFDRAVQKGVDYLHSIAYRKNNQNAQFFDVLPITIVYNHKTARPVDNIRPDPQWHAHAITMRKAVRTNDHKFATIDNYPFFNNQKRGGAIFRASLANDLRKLGYKIERIKDSYVDEKNKKVTVDSFRIVGITDEQRVAFSHRSESLKQELDSNATTLDKKNKIAEIRQNKAIWDEEELKFKWLQDAKSVGLDKEFFKEIKKIKSGVYQLSKQEIIKKASWKGQLYQNSLFLVAKEQEQYSGLDAELVIQDMIELGFISKISKYGYSINFDLDSIKSYNTKDNRRVFEYKKFDNKPKIESTIKTKKATVKIDTVANVSVEKTKREVIKEVALESKVIAPSNAKKENSTSGNSANVANLISSYSLETIRNSIAFLDDQLRNPSLSSSQKARLQAQKDALIMQLKQMELEYSKAKIKI